MKTRKPQRGDVVVILNNPPGVGDQGLIGALGEVENFQPGIKGVADVRHGRNGAGWAYLGDQIEVIGDVR
jgi:hypothetical protein